MREFMNTVEPVEIESSIGKLYITPMSRKSVQVNAPNLSAGGTPLRADAFLVRGDKGNFALISTFDLDSQRFVTASTAIQATLVDGRSADVIVLGKIAEVMFPDVNQLAASNPAIFLEAEKRSVNNDMARLEREIAKNQEKLRALEIELTTVEQDLNTLSR